MSVKINKEEHSESEQKPLLDASPSSATFTHEKLTGYVMFSVAWAVISSFQFGWNIGVINNPEKVIRSCGASDEELTQTLPPCIPMDAIEWGLVAGIFSIGGLVGALAGGYSCKKLGRRATIIYKNVFLIVGALIMAFSINKEVLTVGRFVVGIGAGVCTAAVPMYVAEISPVRFRGTFGALHQLGVVIAILVSMLMGLGLSNIPGWRILLGFSIVPSVLQLLLAPFTCESPRYLISVGKQIKARISLERIRGTTDVEEELYSLTASQENDSSSQEKINIIQLFQKKSLRKPLIIAIVAQIAQQLSGINGVIMFSSSIFEKLMGEGEAQSQLLTVFVGLVNLVVTILSVYLMDRAGRRALLLFSQYGMAILSILIVVGSLLNVDALIALCVISFVAVFAIGLGPIPWLILPEIFPTSAVAPAASVCVAINWLCSFLVGFLFLKLSALLGSYTFLPFAIISLVAALIMTVMLPETKGKNIEQVTELLK